MSYGCHNKVSQTEWLERTEIFYYSSRGYYNSEVRVFRRAPSVQGCRSDPALAFTPGIFFFLSCDSISSTTPILLCVSTFYLKKKKQKTHIGLGPPLMTFLTWWHLQRPCFQIRPRSKVLGSWNFNISLWWTQFNT